MMPLLVEGADEEAMENGSLESIDLNDSEDDAHQYNTIEMVDLADQPSISTLSEWIVVYFAQEGLLTAH